MTSGTLQSLGATAASDPAERSLEPTRRGAPPRRRRAADSSRDGLAQASMRGIARDAGVGLGTLQNHFPTKETLWKSVIDELIVPAEEHFSVVSGPEALVTEIVRHRLASAVHRPGLAGPQAGRGGCHGHSYCRHF